MPRQVTKAYAIARWAVQQAIDCQAILYAGDSGNDSAAFAAGLPFDYRLQRGPEVLQAAQAAHARSAGPTAFSPPRLQPLAASWPV
ncbi:MAG: HAD family hydrolase [Pirellulaceae bacterium]